jgi:hypothetical protein
VIRDAIFNGDRSKRYLLVRDWSEAGPARTLSVIGLNPSIAGVDLDDMTVRKDIGFAKRWGFNRIVLTNLIPDVSTDPWKLPFWRGFDGENIRLLHSWANDAEMVLAAWGSQPKSLARNIGLVEHILHLRNNVWREVHCIGRTKNGYPLHPSRTSYTDAPEVFWEAREPDI